MDLFKKYILDYLRYKLSTILAGRKDYEEWRAANHALKRVEIKNKKLAREIENECKNKGGFLTYGEYLLIDQFGKNGYHANHKIHGITDMHHHWGRAIAKLCLDNKIENVLEVGPGEGDLAVEILKAAKKTGQNIKWSGIELNPDLIKEIKQKLKKNGFENNIGEVVIDFNQQKNKKRSIIVFSYVLDSIAPEIFINTTNKKGGPNTMIGVTVKDDHLQEFIMDNVMLKKKNISFEGNIYHKKGESKFNLSSWITYPNQRVYLPITSFSEFAKLADKFSDSLFVIIDEFQPPPYAWDTRNLCMPKDLHRFKREIDNLEIGYREAGENLLYFQIYFLMFYKFLNSLGFRSVKYEVEQKMARDIVGDKWLSVRNYLTYAFIASEFKKNKNEIYPLQLPRIKIF